MTVIVTVEGMPMSVAVEIPKGKPLHPNGPKRVRVVRSDAAPPPPEITARFDWGYRNTEHRIPETDEGLDPFRGLAPLAMQVEFESDKIYGRWVYPYPSDPVWRGQEKIYAKYGYPPVSSRQPKCELRFPGRQTCSMSLPRLTARVFAPTMYRRGCTFSSGKGWSITGNLPA